MKPKLVFFQWDHRGLPPFLQLHMQLHQKCLSLFFDVSVINFDCDYAKVCEEFQPDLVLFESGYKSQISRKIKVTNTHSHPQVPKLGLHNGDGWCDCRTGFISDMDHWGIETFFTISTTTAEHTPNLADQFFVWPNFIDTEIYRDYHQNKIIPVMISGCINPLYPWREKIHPIVSSSYPSLVFPHTGYESRSPIMIYGRDYARTINASWFVPACGTVARELVRKHMEVPGSKSCLITERSPVLEAAGFQDMINCVFADEKNVLDKINHLFSLKDNLIELIQNGFNLVHRHHSMEHRDQIYQWFLLQKELLPHQKIIQEGPFCKLKVVGKSSMEHSIHLNGNGMHLECLRRGDEAFKKQDFDQAIVLYKECEQMIPWMNEPQLKLTCCYLYKGQAGEALKSILKPLQANLGTYGAQDPDPVEWAFYLLALLCNGQLSAAYIRKEQFPTLFHPMLNGMHKVIDLLHHGKLIKVYSGGEKVRKSIHYVDLKEISWNGDLDLILRNCNQFEYASRLRSWNDEVEETIKENRLIKWIRIMLYNIRMKGINSLNSTFDNLNIPNRRKGLPSISFEDYLVRLGKRLKAEKLRNFF